MKESFRWTQPIQFYKEESGVRLYRVRAITVGTTGNRNMYTADELCLAARSLADRPLNLNHGPWLPYPENKVVDAEFEDDAVEGIIRVKDSATTSLIDAGKIRHTSIEAQARAASTVGSGRMLKGLVFTGMALVSDDFTPGDPDTSVQVWEMLIKKAIPFKGTYVPDSTLDGETKKEKDVLDEIKEISVRKGLKL